MLVLPKQSVELWSSDPIDISLRRFAFATHRCPPSKGEVGLAKGFGGDVVFRPYRHLPAVLRLRQVRLSPFESLDPGHAFYQQPRYITG